MADGENTVSALETSGIVIPQEVAKGIFKKAQDGSVLAKLAPQGPQMKYGESKVMTLTGRPRAELVGEGDDKSPSGVEFGDKTVTPRKLQVTVRVSNEVEWADQDYKLGVWDEIEESAGVALARALDLVGIHKINPLTGAVAATVSEGIADTSNTVTLPASNPKYDEAVEAAVGAIIAQGFSPSGIALDNTFAFNLSQMRDNENRKLYPELGFGQNIQNFEGLAAAVGTTVSGAPEIATPSKILAVVGQMNAFRWGVQRNIGAEVIRYGDPDGLGDLKRKNQVAIRLEIVYGIGIMDLAAFALVKQP